MKKVFVLAMAVGLASLAACNTSPREQAAENIEANADMVADNLEDAADGANMSVAEGQLENQTGAVRATGEN